MVAELKPSTATREEPKPVQLANDIMVLLIMVVVIAGMMAYAGFLFKRLNDPSFWSGPVPPTEFIGGEGR